MAFTDKITPSNDEDLKQIIKDLKNDMKALRDDVGNLQKDSSNFASASAGVAKSGIEDAAEKVVRMSRDTTDHLKKDVEDTTQSLRDTVRDNPIAALGVATAVGMILGRRILR